MYQHQYNYIPVIYFFYYFAGKTKRAFLIRGSEITRNNRAERLVTIEI